MNPNIIKLTENVKIKTACDKNKKWVYGVDIICKTHGQGSHVMFSDCKKYNNEKDAIKKATETIYKYLERNNEIKLLKEIKKSNEQLTMF